MGGGPDFQSRFRAAKSARATATKLTGAQIRELREQQRLKKNATVPDDEGMPPPPPRPKAAATFHPDSQATILHVPPQHGTRTEASVNQVPKPSHAREESVTSAYHPNPGGTSSAQQQPVKISMGPATDLPESLPGTPAVPSVSGSGTTLPKGFFEDSSAQSKAQGEKPPSKEQMAEEYADFMRQIESESVAAAAQQATEEQEIAEDQRERDEFEQFVRIQRLEALKQAASQRGKKKPETDSPLEEASAAILSVDGPVSVSKDALNQSAKRRKTSSGGTEESHARDEESGTSDDELFSPGLGNWRAKASSNI